MRLNSDRWDGTYGASRRFWISASWSSNQSWCVRLGVPSLSLSTVYTVLENLSHSSPNRRQSEGQWWVIWALSSHKWGYARLRSCPEPFQLACSSLLCWLTFRNENVGIEFRSRTDGGFYKPQSLRTQSKVILDIFKDGGHVSAISRWTMWGTTHRHPPPHPLPLG